MIVVVSLNSALDVTYHVESLVHGASHPVASQHERAGGKGVNVARVLHQLDAPTLLLGFSGGRRGVVVAEELSAAGIDARLVPITGETRRTVTVVDSCDATVLLEAGPHCSPAEWTAFLVAFDLALDTSVDVVVLSGSRTLGVPVDAYAQLIELASSRSIRTIVDSSAAELHAALAARPFLAKPNKVEAAALLGDGPSLVEAVREAGAANAVISDGAAGLTALLDDVTYVVRGPAVQGNPTGAGDALTAALASGVAAERGWPDLLRDAVAIATAAVSLPYAGEFDPSVAEQVRPLITVEEL